VRAGSHVRPHPQKLKAGQLGEDALFLYQGTGIVTAGVADGTSAAGVSLHTLWLLYLSEETFAGLYGWLTGMPALVPAVALCVLLQSSQRAAPTLGGLWLRRRQWRSERRQTTR
jgi:hypothetical protein